VLHPGAIAPAVERACESAEDDWLALDLAAISLKLEQLGLADEEVQVVKRMAVGEHDVEMAWPLGMAFFGRNKSPFEERQAAVMHTFLPS
jgi:hypothetical protein